MLFLTILYYNSVFVKGENYNYDFYAVKQGKCVVSLYLDGKLLDSWNVEVTSDDKNWATYENWLYSALKDIEASNPYWQDLNSIQKVALLGQYILDHYDYNEDPNKSFHNHGCGNCNASASVLKDYAQRLGLKSEVVNPSYWSSVNPSHVVARIDMGDKYYDIEAGYSGKAGNRGKVGVVVLNK